MEILIGIVVGILAVLAIPAFFILKWFFGPIFMGDRKGGRDFH